jgi:hypothetical protein
MCTGGLEAAGQPPRHLRWSEPAFIRGEQPGSLPLLLASVPSRFVTRNVQRPPPQPPRLALPQKSNNTDDPVYATRQ